jgi:tetratricopeptide (TPR) repeat protein
MRSARAALLAIALCAAPAAAQTAAPRAASPEARSNVQQAMALHDEARALYEKGEYQKAIEKLEKALELDPGGTELVYNLAVLHEKLLQFEAAEAYYRLYLDRETDPKLRARALVTLKRIEGARRAFAERQRAEAAAAAGAHPPAAAPAPAAAPPARRVDPLVITLAAVAGGALVAGTTLGVVAAASSPGGSASTGPGVSIDDLQAEASRAHRLAVVADASFIVGALAGGAALYAWLARAPARKAPSSSTVRAAFGPAGGRLQVSF